MDRRLGLPSTLMTLALFEFLVQAESAGSGSSFRFPAAAPRSFRQAHHFDRMKRSRFKILTPENFHYTYAQDQRLKADVEAVEA